MDLPLSDVSSVLSSINVMTHALSECLLHGKATSHMASHTDSEGLFLLSSAHAIFTAVRTFESYSL